RLRIEISHANRVFLTRLESAAERLAGDRATPAMFQYSIYGLGLLSDTALPELQQLADVKPDISVRLQVDCHAEPGTARWLLNSTLPSGDYLALCGKMKDGYLLRFVGVADFLIDRLGRELRCTRIEPGTSPQTL